MEVMNFGQRAEPFVHASKTVVTHCIHVNIGMGFQDYEVSCSKYFALFGCPLNADFSPKESTHIV